MPEFTLPNADQFERIIQQMEISNQSGPRDDVYGSPGPQYIAAGTKQAGFYGFVKPHEFGYISGNVAPNDAFNGENLALAIGLSEGVAYNNDAPFLKFSWNGKILFVPMKPLRRSIDWDAIYNAGAVYGTGSTITSGEQFMLDNDENYSTETRVEQGAQVTIGGYTYKVRLMRGAGSDPTASYDDADRGSAGAENEWNKLILPLHERAPSSFRYNNYADTPTDDWGVGLTDQDLITHTNFGLGSYSWCQETRDTILEGETSNTRRVLRGYYGASFLYAATSSHASSHHGWRPVLELI